MTPRHELTLDIRARDHDSAIRIADAWAEEYYGRTGHVLLWTQGEMRRDDGGKADGYIVRCRYRTADQPPQPEPQPEPESQR